jgi:hypothetical protein
VAETTGLHDESGEKEKGRGHESVGCSLPDAGIEAEEGSVDRMETGGRIGQGSEKAGKGEWRVGEWNQKDQRVARGWSCETQRLWRERNVFVAGGHGCEWKKCWTGFG